MSGRSLSGARQSWIGPWDGLFLSAGVTYLVCAILFGDKDTPRYVSMNNGLLVVSIAAALLFVLRVRFGFGRMPPLRTRAGLIAHAKSGQLGLDLFFALDALAVVFVLDLRFWRGYGVKIGVVAAIALLKLAISALRPSRR